MKEFLNEKLELEVFVVHFTSVLHFALGFQNLANWNIEVAKAKEINQDSTTMASKK